MRITVISSSVFTIGGTQGLQGYGGLETIAWHIAKGLAEKGHDVSLIAPQGSTCPGVKVYETTPPGIFSDEQAYRGCVYKDHQGRDIQWGGYWRKLLESNASDHQEMGVIIDSSWQHWSLMLKAEGVLRCPIINILHAPVNTQFGSLPPVEKPCFVCISKDHKAHFDALHSPVKSEYIYNGIDLDFYKPINLKRSNRYLFLARFSSIKGPDIAIEACKEAGVGLDLVGDTTITGEPALLEKCKQMADGDQIRIIGAVSRSETVWWFSQARALLHPNQRFREPFGLAPVEAQACGCPVVAFDYGAMRETILPGGTGYLVENKAEMVKLLKANVLDNINRQDCIRWVSNFSIQHMIDAYERLCLKSLTNPW